MSPILQHTPSSISSVQFSSVIQSCSTLCDPMNHSTPGLPVPHQLPDSTQTHVHWVSDAIQPSHPPSSPSPLALNLPVSGSFPMSQHFASGGQSIGVSASASVLPMNTQDWSQEEANVVNGDRNLNSLGSRKWYDPGFWDTSNILCLDMLDCYECFYSKSSLNKNNELSIFL